jgi:transmembrane sensor
MSEEFMQVSDQINKQAAEYFTLMSSADVSATDHQEFSDWLLEHAEHQEAYKQIELVWQSLGDLSDTAEGRALRRSVEPFTSKLKALFVSPVERMKTLIPAPKYALSFAVICAAVVMILQPTSHESITTHYSTQAGEIKTIMLADNSEITLGAKSKMTTRISDVGRSVNLTSGEAFFNVVKDQRKPFTVTVSHVSVEVVGTQFNVQKIRDTVSVSVLEGIVKVFGQGSKDSQSFSLPAVVLTAGQKVVKAKDRAFESVKAVPSSDLGAWRLGRLIYRDIALADVVTDAGRYFDGKILLQSEELADEKITVTLRTDQIDQLPQMLAETLPIKVHVISDNLILLKK